MNKKFTGALCRFITNQKFLDNRFFPFYWELINTFFVTYTLELILLKVENIMTEISKEWEELK